MPRIKNLIFFPRYISLWSSIFILRQVSTAVREMGEVSCLTWLIWDSNGDWMKLPAEIYTILAPRNLPIDVSELRKIRQLADFQALKLWNVWSGVGYREHIMGKG